MDGVDERMVVGRQHRCALGRGDDRDRGRDRRARPLRLGRPVRGGDRLGDHDDAGRRPRAGDGRHHVVGDGQPRADAPGLGGVADQLRVPGQGQRLRRRAVARAGPGRRDRVEDPRGLGGDARSDRRVAARRRRARHAGPDPHRHAERVGLLRGHDRGDRRAHDPHLPLGGRGRRPRAGHHPGRRRGQLPAVVDQPDQSVHGQHVRRAPRHGDGLPSPQPARARGRRVRRVADPARDDRGRGRAARHRRDQRARVRLAGDGPNRRDDRAHVAAGVEDEESSAARCPRTPAAATTTTGSSATSRS